MSNSPTLPSVTGLQRTPTPVHGLPLDSDAPLQSALLASARAEASLNGLFRSIQQLGDGVGGAREANETLTHELEALRDMLGAANEQHSALGQKVTALEQALERAHQDTDKDRAFLIDQQDAFIVLLLDEQDVELRRRDIELDALHARVAELERRESTPVATPAAAAGLAAAQPEGSSPRAHSAPFSAPPPSDTERAERAELERTARKLSEDRERARETLQRLQAQRDEAQGMVLRISKERDDALQQVHWLKSELGGPRISTRPPSADTRRDSAPPLTPAQPNDLLTLDGLELEARLDRPTMPSQPSLTRGSQPTSPASSSARPAPVISSVLSPPRSDPLAALTPISSRLTPAPSRLSPPPPPGRQSTPPEELRRALTNPPAASASSNRPALKQKPDASTRPLVGYSMSGEVRTEHLEGVRLSSKPPPGVKQR